MGKSRVELISDVAVGAKEATPSALELGCLSKEYVRDLATSRGISTYVGSSRVKRTKDDLIMCLGGQSRGAGARRAAGDIEDEGAHVGRDGWRVTDPYRGRRGLYNWANTCYLGSVLQLVVDKREGGSEAEKILFGGRREGYDTIWEINRPY